MFKSDTAQQYEDFSHILSYENGQELAPEAWKYVMNKINSISNIETKKFKLDLRKFKINNQKVHTMFLMLEMILQDHVNKQERESKVLALHLKNFIGKIQNKLTTHCFEDAIVLVLSEERKCKENGLSEKQLDEFIKNAAKFFA